MACSEGSTLFTSYKKCTIKEWVNNAITRIRLYLMTTTNPLVAKLRLLDGVTVRLPSRGLLYETGVLDENVVGGEVRVFPMTTRDEILMRSPDGLFGGTTIQQIFSRCVPDVKKPLELFFNDVDFLIVALRQVSYGDEMEISYTHDCDGAKEHSYIVSVDSLIRNVAYLDPLTIIDQFTVRLSSGQHVSLRPIRLIDMMDILRPDNPDQISTETIEEDMMRLYVSQIASVDDVSDPDLIVEWMRLLPMPLVREIRAVMAEQQTWGITYEQNITCRDCKAEMVVNTPLNPVTFFSLR